MNSVVAKLKKNPLCLVAALDGDDLFSLAQAARSAQADMIEVRMDFWGNFLRTETEEKMKRLKKLVGVPILVSFREGSPFPAWWTTDHWQALAHASLVDVEWNPTYPWAEIQRSLRRLDLGLIISHHDYKKTPPLKTLVSIARSAYAKNADIVKIATKTLRESDVVTLQQLSSAFSPKRLVSAMGMGELGPISRFASPLYGSCLLYGYIGKPTAAGQCPYSELKNRIRALYPRYGRAG